MSNEHDPRERFWNLLLAGVFAVMVFLLVLAWAIQGPTNSFLLR